MTWLTAGVGSLVMLVSYALSLASHRAGGARGGGGIRYLLGGAAVAVRGDILPPRFDAAA